MKEIFCGIQHLSLSDYDNEISCVLFTKGCNFNCPFCHNAQLLTSVTVSNDEVFSFLNEKRGKIDAVVITGGEPTLHPELIEIIKKIKDLGFKVKLDSNGTNPIVLEYLISNALIDYVAMDIKTCFNNYNDICKTSVDIESIKESIRIINSSNIGFEFRTTLINEYHNIDTITKMADDIKGIKKLVLQKYVLRDSCPNQSLTEVSNENKDIFKDILSKTVVNVLERGYK